MKFLLLILLLACSSAPEHKRLAHQDIKHKECLIPVNELSVSLPRKFQNALVQTTGMAGSYLVTGVGLVSDTVVVSTGIASLALCGYGNGGNGCGDLFGGYLWLAEELDLVWTTKKAYVGTTKWRCPDVDHISRAFRKTSECLHDKGEYVAAFEQMNRVQDNDVLSECVSESEKEKLRNLEVRLRTPVPEN